MGFSMDNIAFFFTQLKHSRLCLLFGIGARKAGALQGEQK
jgi:hypothetical protein